jgi:hypothetical protein
MVFSGYPSISNLVFASLLYFFTRCRKCNILVDAATTPSPSSSLFIDRMHNITANMPDEQRLFYTLMAGYEKAVRPTKKASDPVVVKLGITLTQIMDIVSNEIQIGIKFPVFCIFRMNEIK